MVRIKGALARLGCSLKSVKPDGDFVRAVKRARPQVILLGAVRGNPGRADLYRMLKNDAQARSILVLALLDSRPAHAQWSQAALADEVIAGTATDPEIALRLRSLLKLSRLNNETRRALKLIREQSRLDDLTGLATHGVFKERVEREFQRATRYRRPLSVLMADVDYLKRYNDRFGHPAGDRLLRLVGRMVAGVLRRVDFGARYGGDEFSVILPETPKVAAAVVAERIRSSIEKHPFPHRQSQPLGRVTISIGVATFPEDAGAADKLVEAADRFLYQAKADGRNQVRGSDLPLAAGRETAP
jgi:diguanylate cyclase (GGDEF)-like protein